MPLPSAALTKQKLCLDFANLKHTCPKGVYVAPVPDNPLLWTGVLFVRKGPYANAILRFQIEFSELYPDYPPIVTFLSDVFHPLVTPLTTYTYSTRDTGTDTVSAADKDRLPSGGLSLRHGFPEWFDGLRDEAGNKDVNDHNGAVERGTPLTVEILQYIRIVFDTEAVLDTVPLEVAANTGAWHAWKSYRAKILGGRATSPETNLSSNASDTTSVRSTSPRQQQQPGGARRPGEWNWQGVWEDRVKKSVTASISEQMLYGSDSSDIVCFSKVDSDAISEMRPSWKDATVT